MEGTPLILKKKKDNARREEDKEYVAPEKLLPYFQIDKSYVGHEDEVMCVRVYKDRVYSSSIDGKIFVWDKLSYKQLSAFEGHEDSVNALAIYDDKATGKIFVISASDDRTVGVFEKSSKLPQKVLKGHTGWVYAVAADDKHIYSAGFDGLVHVWDWDRSAAAQKDAQPTYQLKYTWKGHTGKINSICVDPSNNMVYTASSDGTIMAWDKTQDNVDGPAKIFRGHTDGVHCVYSYKERLYSASYDRSVKIWDKTTANVLKSVPVNPDGTETHRGFLFDIVVQGELPNTTQHPMKIYTSSYSGAVQTWHLLTGQNIQTLRRPGATTIRSLTVDGDTIFAALTDGSIQTWHTVPGDPVHKIEDHTGSVKAVFVDESQFYTASVDKSIIIWNKKTQTIIKRLYGHERGLRCLYVRDGKIYSGSEDRSLIVWDKMTGDLLMRLSGHGGAVTTVFVDEGRIYTGSEDEKIRIWDKESGVLIYTINPGEAKIEEEEEPLPETRTNYDQDKKKDKKKKYGFVHNIVVYGDKIFAAVLKRIDIYNKLTFTFLGSLTGHKETVTGLCIYTDPRTKTPLLYSSSEDKTVRVWPKTTLEISGKIKEEYYKDHSVAFPSKAGKIYSLHIDMGRIYAGALSGEIEIMDVEDGKILKTLTGHTSWIYSIHVDEGRVYSGSFDQTVRIWDVECYQVPAFFQQCMAFETVYDHSTEYMDQRDTEERTSLMICARAGSTENAHNLVRIGTKYGLTHTTKYGESALFFALRTENWEFLKSFVDALKKQEAALRESALRDSNLVRESTANLNQSFEVGTIRTLRFKKGTIRETVAAVPAPLQIEISPEDFATRQLLINRAKAGDISFFEEFFKLGFSFVSREVVSAAIEANHVWFCKRWKHINKDAVLHAACYFGRPDCVKELMKRTNITINKKDPHNMNSLPIHICHMNADHSAMNNRDVARKKEEAAVMHGELLMKKEWVPEKVWNRYEYDLIMRRTECFRAICDTKEITKRPKYKEKNANGRTSYDEALALHDYTMEAMKIPKKEITDRLENIHRKRLFYESEKVLDFYQQLPEIEALRIRFATKSFIKESVGYLVFLILLTTVGLLMSTNGSGSVYQMNAGLNSYLLGDAFSGVSDEGSFWDFFNSNFLPAVFPEGNVTQSDGYIMGFNKIIGAIRFRQLKVRDNSCKIRSLYADETSTCCSPQYSSSTQDTEPYGPDNRWTYDHSAGDRYWTETDGTWLPSGGYIADIPSDSLDSATNVLSDLQSNGWITPGTRYILVSMNVYNGNETGQFGVLRLEFAFTASGVVMTSNDFTIWGPNGYDIDILPAGVIKIILQFIVTLYILYAFLFTEFIEIRQAIAEAREFINSLKKHNLANEVGDPIWEGLKDYWSQLWNYYEWTIIIVFIIILGMEISVIAGFASLDLHPNPSTYINLQTITTTSNFEIDLLALFILMNWLRLLKFLRIPKFTGPMVQSVMDTLQNGAVIVFVFIVFYIVLAFSLCYHIAFGPDIPEYATYAESAISIFQGLFGGPDYGSLLASNAVFGPVLFVFFMLFTIVLLMNLLIGVLGDAYNDAQEVNLSVWNRFITRLMIESLPTRCVPDSIRAEKRGFFDRIRRRGFWQQLNEDLEKVTAAEQDDENAETPIYYDDDQLDDMVCGEDKEQFENQIEFEMDALEVEEAKKLLLVKKQVEEKSDEEIIIERLENMEKANEELKDQNKKMAEQLDLLVKLMTQNVAPPSNNNNQ